MLINGINGHTHKYLPPCPVSTGITGAPVGTVQPGASSQWMSRSVGPVLGLARIHSALLAAVDDGPGC